MIYSIIPKYKNGNCANPLCGATETEVIKVGKETYCLNCRSNQKNKIQIQKANERSQVRGLRGKQKENNLEDAASRQNLIVDCDIVFSRVVRLREADQYLNTLCFTCGDRKHFSLHQCGHYVKRGNMALRFDFRNSKVQCRNCNENLHGNYEVYKTKLNEEENGIADQLEQEGRDIYKYSIEELKQLLFDLRQKLKPLELKLKK